MEHLIKKALESLESIQSSKDYTLNIFSLENMHSINVCAYNLRLWIKHNSDHSEFISSYPDVCHGLPCFKGSRILVSVILDLIKGGNSDADIRKEIPSLTPEQLSYARTLVKHSIHIRGK